MSRARWRGRAATAPRRTRRLRRQRQAWEPWLAGVGAQLSTLFSALAILLSFVWINLAALDWFAHSAQLSFAFERLPARDLSYSIAWAVYALLLLAIGMRRRLVVLRHVSLGLLVITIGKVFLFDLGYLEDMYRVASLGGLAASLFVVSLAYQRLVFRSDASAE